MARPIKGEVTEHVGKDRRTYRGLRFVAYGKRRRVPLGVVSADEADRALGHVIADVERGTWRPEAERPQEVERAVPTFHEFAEEWWTLNEGQLARKTQADYKWRLQVHLIPFFRDMRLDAITFEAIERYIAAKLTEDDPLSPRSINMTVTLLGAILERAHKRRVIEHNPARDKDLRVRERTPPRSYLDNAGQIAALLNAAGELDRQASRGRTHIERRAMIAVLIYAGPRIGELCAIRERDWDLANGWLSTGSKTEVGYRRIKVRGALRDEMLALRARRGPQPAAAYTFGTRTGGRMSPDNFRSRVLAAVIKRANANLERDGLPPLPEKITPHSLRRTFCSLLYALGEDPGTVMDEMGHTDPELALRVYRQAMRRGEDEKAQLRALIEGADAPEFRPTSGQRGEIEESQPTGESGGAV